MGDRLVILAVYLATACIVFIAVRVEILNARAGYTLPNDAAMAESRKHGGSGAWRATWMDEQRWRRWFIRDEHGEPDPRPLTAAEREQMRRDIERMNANYRLRAFVGAFGCVQYPLVLFVIACATQLARGARRWTAALHWAAVGVAAAACGLAVYRGYIRSLID